MQISNWGKGLAVAAALTLCGGSALAQDDDGGPQTQGDDARYVSASMVNFKPGKRERAFEIIAEHFKPAGEAAGTPGPLGVIHFQTGEWDAIFVWALEGGMADLEWYRTEDDIKWFEALAEQEGSVEAAEALLAEYSSLVDNAVTNVGHYHAEEEDSDE
ncbi:MAG: hypothetical protein AAFN50_02750 [Pseudomonadota bacterium]